MTPRAETPLTHASVRLLDQMTPHAPEDADELRRRAATNRRLALAAHLRIIELAARSAPEPGEGLRAAFEAGWLARDKEQPHVGSPAGYAAEPVDPTLIHDASCCAARGCHPVCSHLCGTELHTCDGTEHLRTALSSQPEPATGEAAELRESGLVCGHRAFYDGYIDPDGCGESIVTVAEVYRCTDCRVPFHVGCANRHFARSAPEPSEALAAYQRACVGIPGIEDGRDSYEPWQERIRRVIQRFGGAR